MKYIFPILFAAIFFSVSAQAELKMENLEGAGVWTDPRFKEIKPRGKIRITVWFDEQFLGDGKAYLRRTKEFQSLGRTELRKQLVSTLKAASRASQNSSKEALDGLIGETVISDLDFFWIVNGFSCTATIDGLVRLKEVPGVRKIFFAGRSRTFRKKQNTVITPVKIPKVKRTDFDPAKFEPLWYIKKLKVDRVWNELNVSGKGTLNVVHDANFILSDWTLGNIYRNENETPNGKDDDGNGLLDDVNGFDFTRNIGSLTRQTLPEGKVIPRVLHGHQCVGIICGRGSDGYPHQPGLAPDSQWAGVLASQKIEAAVEWAIEQEADTYSMSFSRPNMGDFRSHWRKVMEHGSFCGIHFVSGAGNFAKTASIPIQMRIPEDIPHAVFAAAGVQRDLSRTPFSSQGPVEWKTAHYRDGRVNKPEVCAFNFQIPLLTPKGGKSQRTVGGNSFAGPMFCGTIALMLSANPELKPWETRQIIIETATDIADKGFDFQTGHGLINAFEAVKRAQKLLKSVNE